MEVYENGRELSHNDRKAIRTASKSVTTMIIKHFEAFPSAKISPTEFKRFYGLKNPVQGIRPRFNTLVKQGILQALENEKAISEYGKEEMKYALIGKNNQLSII